MEYRPLIEEAEDLNSLIHQQGEQLRSSQVTEVEDNTIAHRYHSYPSILIVMGGLVIAGPLGAIVATKVGLIAGAMSSICGFVTGCSIMSKVTETTT